MEFKDQRELFAHVWATTPHTCACGARIHQPLAYCFAHRLPKSTYPEYRLVPCNIELVCSLPCHHAVDARRKAESWAWRREAEAWCRANGGTRTKIPLLRGTRGG